MSGLTIALLGPSWVTLDDQPLYWFATDKVHALLVYLAVESDRAHRRGALAALLWPDHPQAAAFTSLRQALYRLRRALGDRQASVPYLLTSDKEVRWNPSSDTWLDVAELEARISAWRARSPRGPDLPPEAVANLEAAVELYRGDFLCGFALPACPRFEWWQLSTQESCHHQVMDALHQLVVYYEAQRDYASVSRYAWRQTELEPWRESAHRRCMRALALSGQRGEALHQYEICRYELAQDMGVEPSAKTVRLYKRIRGGMLSGLRRAPDIPAKPLRGFCPHSAGARPGTSPRQRRS